MKINGITPIIKTLRGMQETLTDKIDNLDWDKPNATDKDENLNQAWDSLEVAIDEINSILEIQPRNKAGKDENYENKK